MSMSKYLHGSRAFATKEVRFALKNVSLCSGTDPRAIFIQACNFTCLYRLNLQRSLSCKDLGSVL